MREYALAPLVREQNATGRILLVRRMTSIFSESSFSDPTVPQAPGLGAILAPAINQGLGRCPFDVVRASSSLLAIQKLQGHTFLPSSVGANTFSDDGIRS
jgi:hypothetical protein